MQQLAFPLQYIRQQAAAIDVDQVFALTSDRTNYLSNARRYPGQIVSDTQTGDVYMLNAAGNAWITIGGTGAGVASISSSDSSITFSASTGTVSAILNLGHTNIFTVGQVIRAAGLANNTTNALILSNNTASTASAPQVQYSPSLELDGSAWNTSALLSQPAAFAFYVKTTAGNPITAAWKLQASVAGASLSEVFSIDNTGGISTAHTFSATNTFTASQSVTLNALGTTTQDGWRLFNTTAAAAGAQQVSPSLIFKGFGWKTTATAASQAVVFQMYVLPVQGTTNPTGTWKLQAGINGSAVNDVFTIDNSGNALLTGSLSLGALSTSTVLLSLAGTTAKSSFRIPIGVAPTSPVQGDFWATSGALNYRDGSTTYNLITNAPTTEARYTPTNTAVTNVSLLTNIRSSYSRAGNTVTVSIAANVQPTATGITTWTMTLPFASSQTSSYTVGHLAVNENPGVSPAVVNGIVNIGVAPSVVTASFVATATSAGNLVPFLALFTYTLVD